MLLPGAGPSASGSGSGPTDAPHVVHVARQLDAADLIVAHAVTFVKRHAADVTRSSFAWTAPNHRAIETQPRQGLTRS